MFHEKEDTYTLETFMILVVAAIAAVLVIKLLSAPIRLAFKLLLNALSGFVTLFLLNFIGTAMGVSLGINFFNAVVVGILGVPGVVLLLLLKYLL